MDNDAPSTQINRKSIRAALRDWDSLKNLSTSALTGLQVVCQRRLQKGYADSLIGSGLALREVLQEAMESLRPVSGSENPTEKRWRPYTFSKSNSSMAVNQSGLKNKSTSPRPPITWNKNTR